MKQVIFFGDSLTAGYGLKDAATTSFPSLLGKKMKECGIEAHVLNAGKSGETTASALLRLDTVLELPVDVFV